MKKNKLSYHSKAGFKVPENYFDDLEARLIDISSSSGEALANSEKGKPGFGVPDNYFEQLEEKVLQKVETKRKAGKVISILNREVLYYAAAVAAILLIVVPSVLLKPVETSGFSMDTVEISSIEFYINSGYIDFNFNEISSFLTEEDYVVESFNTSNLSDEDVFYYLSEQVEDPNYLLE